MEIRLFRGSVVILRPPCTVQYVHFIILELKLLRRLELESFGIPCRGDPDIWYFIIVNFTFS